MQSRVCLWGSGILFCQAFLVATAVAQSSGRQESVQERNVRTFIEYQTDIANGDKTRLDEQMAETMVIYAMGADSINSLLGRPATATPFVLKRDDWRNNTSFKDVSNHTREFDAIYGVDDMVIARWRIKGVVNGKVFGFEAHGRPIDLTEVAFVRFDAQGRLSEGWFRLDAAELFQQLGVKVEVPAPRTPGGE